MTNRAFVKTCLLSTKEEKFLRASGPSKLQLLQLGTESIPPKMAEMAAVTFDTKISDTGDIFPTCCLLG